jgi:hypothetical protein
MTTRRAVPRRDSASLSPRRGTARAVFRVSGIPTSRRRERRQTLEKFFKLFEGNHPLDEIRRLKADDEGL